ncbi:MAG: GNAT family N-acetyltransferase [Jatrophihabitantaceae bacterium]
MAQEQISVRDNPGAARYEAFVDGVPAGFAAYRDQPGRRVFTHTKVDPDFEGHGVGGALARSALDDVRAKGLAVVPRCPFISGWIAHHREYADLIAP